MFNWLDPSTVAIFGKLRLGTKIHHSSEGWRGAMHGTLCPNFILAVCRVGRQEAMRIWMSSEHSFSISLGCPCSQVTVSGQPEVGECVTPGCVQEWPCPCTLAPLLEGGGSTVSAFSPFQGLLPVLTSSLTEGSRFVCSLRCSPSLRSSLPLGYAPFFSVPLFLPPAPALALLCKASLLSIIPISLCPPHPGLQ